MATIVLSAAGAALGASFGGTVLGLSSAVIGRAVGATLGRVIDQRLLGAGSDAVEVGRVDRFRLMGASEGSGMAQVYGRARIAGQVIWATRFAETASTSGGGKGAARPKTTSYSYSVSLALALCEGEILSVGRIWADGTEIAPAGLNLRVYRGTEDQQPDPKIAAVEGPDQAPAYRGVAYVVIEDLELAPFGNRVPQLSFEVLRAAQGAFANAASNLQRAVRAVAMIPGTGEYALATTAVHYKEEEGVSRSANVNTPSEKTDFETAVGQLRDELPNVGSVSLVVSWFGNDLRAGHCTIQPKVEQKDHEGEGMAWRAGGITRAEAAEGVRVAGRSVYGGTPADQSVIEAIRHLRAGGQEVMFYPFILMDQLEGNSLPNPWTGTPGQPPLPWRGRITTDLAPGLPGTTDRTAAAAAEVTAFFGTAQTDDFAVVDGQIHYTGPAEWRYRRFILHYAHLCALAGGVDAFCIGSEMVALTQIRGAGDSFPAVDALRDLLAEVRSILGPAVKLTYAADWSEYFGYAADGNRYFHLDPLWAEPDVDFIGIDNYMPLSDWRDGEDHADARWGSIHDLAYLKSNIEGGEGYDWYYASPGAEAAQHRTPITDGEGEPWIWRYKDMRNWWLNYHHDRIDGQRAHLPTDWEPQSKPIRFTEYGCAAIDKGSNQPNKFLDPKSSESMLPKYSSGRRDDLMQMQYLRAMHEYWGEGAHNPVSVHYGGRMLDMARAHVWAWDARPFPHFPNNLALWSDGDNHARGHWLNGRATNQSLAAVVAECCERAGLTAFDVSDLRGLVRGFWQEQLGSARGSLQPLMLAYGFDATERDGTLRFTMRDGRPDRVLESGRLAVHPDLSGDVETSRAPLSETPGRVLLSFTEAEGDYQIRQAEARHPEAEAEGVAANEVPLVLTAAESRTMAERWLAEARVAQDSARFALPPSARPLGAGDTVRLGGQLYRIDRADQGEALLIDAVRVEPGVYRPADAVEERSVPRAFATPLPVLPVFLDLPLLTGDEVPHAPHVAATARPWPGAAAIWGGLEDAGYRLNTTLERAAVIGRTLDPLPAAPPGLWDRGPALRVRLVSGALSSASLLAVLNGANALAIGDGTPDKWEIVQFRQADLVAAQTYALSWRLRGQLGTDALMPDVWPVGSRVVLLDGALSQIELPSSARTIARHYRIGAARRGYDDPNVVHRQIAFAGNGLRPYAPVHLTARRLGGDLAVTWVRRSRIGGDDWGLADVPLAETREHYLVQVRQSGAVLREVQVFSPGWTYTAAQQATDGASGPVAITVAQVSESFGPGPARRLEVTL